jgi:hypothetical protein
MRLKPLLGGAACGAVALLVAAFGSATAAGEPASVLFLQNLEFNSATRDITIVSPTEGMIEGAASTYRDQPGEAISIGADPVDTAEDGLFWDLLFIAPPGEVLTAGQSYVRGTIPDNSAWVQLHGWGCSQDAGSFDVLEASFDPQGNPIAFAARFEIGCSSRVVHGEIRYNSTLPIRARDLTPNTLALPLTNIGVVGTSSTVTATNTGNAAIHPTAPGLSAGFVKTADTCTGATIVPGASCSVSVAAKPTAPGAYSGTLTFNDDTVGAARVIPLTAAGYQPTSTISIVSDLNPRLDPGPDARITATVVPATTLGEVQWYVDGNKAAKSDVGSGGKAVFKWGQDRSVTITAEYLGGTYVGPSPRSAPLEQVVLLGSTINAWASPLKAPAGYPVKFEGTLSGHGDGTGTLTVTDLTTGALLASHTVSGGYAFETVERCHQSLDPGLHRLRFRYSGDGNVLPAEEIIEVELGSDELVLVTPPSQRNSGGTWCSNLVPTDGPVRSQLTTREVNVFALGPQPFTQIRVSNTDAIDELNGLSQSAEFPFGSPITWSLIDPAYGGVDEDGEKKFWYQVYDAVDGWSGVHVGFLYIDRQGPAGSVALATQPATGDADVVLDVTATDAISDIETVALSGDATTWDERAYAPQQPWTVDIAADGPQPVWAKWKDASGNWSAAVEGQVLVDTVAPTAGVAITGLPGSGSVSSGKAPVVVALTGSDAVSGIAGFEVARKTDEGAWTTPTAVAGPTTSVVLATGHSHQVRVRSIDGAGNRSAWVTTAVLKLAAIQDSSSAVDYAKTWSKSSNAGYWNGSIRSAKTAGATARIRVTARSVAWVARTAAKNGIATVHVDGVKVATIDLRTSTTRKQRLVWSTSWNRAGTHTVVIKVQGTTGRPQVDLDGFVLLR